jgi:hypothetical protein
MNKTSDKLQESSHSAKARCGAITLTVCGIGNVPSFKNRKRAIRDRKTGKLRTLTEPKTKRWMNNCIDQFESQLSIICRIRDGETVGEWRKRLLTVLLPLQDDSWKHMLPGNQDVRPAYPELAGAQIKIEYE